jgi:predicted CxxxxCH...CXXCH cytochrome family protein
VRPLVHVNGKRDVTFDPVTAGPSPFPSYSLVPSGAYVPSLRYWMAQVSANFAPPRDAATDGPPMAFGTTVSFHLARASYDPATKTCGNVGCHVREISVRWGTPFLERGCVSCH